MSEGRISLKNAVRIIAVTWVLSLITTLAVVYVLPTIRQPSWHEVVRFADNFVDYRRETKFFSVPSDHWRIHWDAMTEIPAPEEAWFRFYVDLESEGRQSRSFKLRELRTDDFEWEPSWSGVEYVTGSGSFSIEVVGKAVLWGIIVESYH